VPVVPVATVGIRRYDEPRRLRVPTVTTVFGEPISFERCEPGPAQVAAARDAIWTRIQALHLEAQRIQDKRLQRRRRWRSRA
jgi:hypothetical protein